MADEHRRHGEADQFSNACAFAGADAANGCAYGCTQCCAKPVTDRSTFGRADFSAVCSSYRAADNSTDCGTVRVSDAVPNRCAERNANAVADELQQRKLQRELQC